MSNNSPQYGAAKLKDFKVILNKLLKTTEEELDTLKSSQENQKKHLANSNVDFNQNSKHFQQQAKNKQLVRRLQRKSRELKSALNRIEEKTYGVCERTGNLIREERLTALPTARFDIRVK